jgi:hypothetical protein
MTLMYGFSPGERGLVEYEPFPVRDFPEDHVARLWASLADANPASGEASWQYENAQEETEEENK